jgi:hypothetical protein
VLNEASTAKIKGCSRTLGQASVLSLDPWLLGPDGGPPV